MAWLVSAILFPAILSSPEKNRELLSTVRASYFSISSFVRNSLSLENKNKTMKRFARYMKTLLPENGNYNFLGNDFTNKNNNKEKGNVATSKNKI